MHRRCCQAWILKYFTLKINIQNCCAVICNWSITEYICSCSCNLLIEWRESNNRDCWRTWRRGGGWLKYIISIIWKLFYICRYLILTPEAAMNDIFSESQINMWNFISTVSTEVFRADWSEETCWGGRLIQLCLVDVQYHHQPHAASHYNQILLQVGAWINMLCEG